MKPTVSSITAFYPLGSLSPRFAVFNVWKRRFWLSSSEPVHRFVKADLPALVYPISAIRG